MNLFSKIKIPNTIPSHWISGGLFVIVGMRTSFAIANEVYSPSVTRFMIIAVAMLFSTFVADRLYYKVAKMRENAMTEFRRLQTRVDEMDQDMQKFLRMQELNVEVQAELSDRLQEDIRETKELVRIIDRRARSSQPFTSRE